MSRATSLYARLGKRVLDLALGVPIVLAAAPAMAATAVVVATKIGRPVLFKQERAGLGGEPFTVLKFRTMTNERSADGGLLPDDKRLTRIGELLRRSSLDELPQLLNVVAGTMSLVGPRPLPARYNDRYTREQRKRLDVKPGVTGWPQVNGRNALSWDEKLALDAWYVDHVSLALDLRILLRTARVVVTREGYAPDGTVRSMEFWGSSGDGAGADGHATEAAA